MALTGALLAGVSACATEDEIRLEGVVLLDPTFEGGDCAILTTERGDRYLLVGGDRSALLDKRYVVVRGTTPDDHGSGCGLGPIFQVTDVECSSPLPPARPGETAAAVPPCARTPR